MKRKSGSYLGGWFLKHSLALFITVAFLPLVVSGKVLSVNCYEDKIADMLFELYKVKEDDRITPCVFIEDTALCGVDQIKAHFSELVGNGEGRKTPRPMEDSSKLKLAIAAFAGIHMALSGIVVAKKYKKRKNKEG